MVEGVFAVKPTNQMPGTRGAILVLITICALPFFSPSLCGSSPKPLVGPNPKVVCSVLSASVACYIPRQMCPAGLTECPGPPKVCLTGPCPSPVTTHNHEQHRRSFVFLLDRNIPLINKFVVKNTQAVSALRTGTVS